GDESRIFSLPVCLGETCEGDGRFPAPRRSDESQSGGPNHDHCGVYVDDDRGHVAPWMGKVSTNRAPRGLVPVSPGMFSALREPPWASAIWRLIERPRPEF